MTNLNAFRPNLVSMEGRSLMSVSPVLIAGDLPEPATIKLQDALISSVQPAESTADYYRELLGRVPDSAATPDRGQGDVILSGANAEAGFFRLFGDANGDGATEGKSKTPPPPPPAPPGNGGHKDTITIESFSWGLTGAPGVLANGYRYELEDVVISGVRVDAETETGFQRPFGDVTPEDASGKATLFVRKQGADNATESVPYELEDVIISGVQVDTAGGYYQQYLGRQADATGVEFQDSVRTARELGSRPV